MIVKPEAFEKMEKELLPVFTEAVNLCKEISHNPNYFKEQNNYRAIRRLYAMALTSKAVKTVNQGISDEEAQKNNIEKLDLLNKRHFYRTDGSCGLAENVFNRSEVADFRNELRELGASYFEDTIVHECLGSLQFDNAVGIWRGNQPLISPKGEILDWKQAKNLGIFKFATDLLKEAMVTENMKKQADEYCWNKKDLTNNYPTVYRECEKIMELKFAQYCKQKQTKQSTTSLLQATQRSL